MVISSRTHLGLYIYCSKCNVWRSAGPGERGHTKKGHRSFIHGSMDCLGPSHCASVLFRKIDQHIANQGGGVMAPQDNAIGIPDEVIVEAVVDYGSESESGFEAVIDDDLVGGAGAEDFIPKAVFVDGQGVDKDSEVEFDFDDAEGRDVRANVVVGVENVPPANLVVPAAPVGNGRPRRVGLSVHNYNENNHDLEVELGVESPIVRKSGSKRRRQL